MDTTIRSAVTGRRRWLVLGALASVAVLVAVLPSLPPGVRNWDNQVKLQLAWNIIQGNGAVLTIPTPDDETYAVTGRDGRTYVNYQVLAPVLQMPTYAVARLGGPVAEGIAHALLLAAVAAVLVAWGGRAGASPAGAVAGAMLACLGTALWPMSAHGYDVLVEVLAFAVLLWAAEGGDRRLDWLVAGLGIGAALATRLGAVILVVPAAVLALGVPPFRPGAALRRGLLLGLGAAPFIVLSLWFNAYRFGSPLTFHSISSMGQVTVPWFSRHHLEGMAGLLFSPGKGLPWYGPPLIGTIALAPRLARAHPRAFAAFAAFAVVGVISLGRLTFWHGEWGWGPRYVAHLYLAVAPLAWWLSERSSRRGTAASAGAIAALAALIALQALPVVGHPVETQFRDVLDPLGRAGLTVTRPITRPPLPEDNAVLYFRPENSMLATVGREAPRILLEPAFWWAMLAPAIAAFSSIAATRLAVPRGGPAGLRDAAG